MLAGVVGTVNDIQISSQISITDGSLQGDGLAQIKSFIIQPDEIKYVTIWGSYFCE